MRICGTEYSARVEFPSVRFPRLYLLKCQSELPGSPGIVTLLPAGFQPVAPPQISHPPLDALLIVTRQVS